MPRTFPASPASGRSRARLRIVRLPRPYLDDGDRIGFQIDRQIGPVVEGPLAGFIRSGWWSDAASWRPAVIVYSVAVAEDGRREPGPEIRCQVLTCKVEGCLQGDATT